MVFTFMMTGCKVNQKYATKINDRYLIGKPLTYNEVILKLGEPFDKEIKGAPSEATGNAEWYQGYSVDEEKKLLEDIERGKRIRAIYVQFRNGEAVHAEYAVINEE